MKIMKGDQVIVIAGKHKGVIGAVLDVNNKKRKVKVSKVNVIRYHKKPSQDSPEGGIIEKEGYIDISNVMIVIKEGKKDIRTRIRLKKDPKKKKKIRIATKTGKEV